MQNLRTYSVKVPGEALCLFVMDIVKAHALLLNVKLKDLEEAILEQIKLDFTKDISLKKRVKIVSKDDRYNLVSTCKTPRKGSS